MENDPIQNKVDRIINESTTALRPIKQLILSKEDYDALYQYLEPMIVPTWGSMFVSPSVDRENFLYRGIAICRE